MSETGFSPQSESFKYVEPATVLEQFNSSLVTRLNSDKPQVLEQHKALAAAEIHSLSTQIDDESFNSSLNQNDRYLLVALDEYLSKSRSGIPYTQEITETDQVLSAIDQYFESLQAEADVPIDTLAQLRRSAVLIYKAARIPGQWEIHGGNKQVSGPYGRQTDSRRTKVDNLISHLPATWKWDGRITQEILDAQNSDSINIYNQVVRLSSKPTTTESKDMRSKLLQSDNNDDTSVEPIDHARGYDGQRFSELEESTSIVRPFKRHLDSQVESGVNQDFVEVKNLTIAQEAALIQQLATIPQIKPYLPSISGPPDKGRNGVFYQENIPLSYVDAPGTPAAKAVQVGQALKAFWQYSGQLNMDVKQSNIRFRSDGSVVILDWGIVASVKPGQDQAHIQGIAGAYMYLNPSIIQAHSLDAGHQSIDISTHLSYQVATVYLRNLFDVDSLENALLENQGYEWPIQIELDDHRTSRPISCSDATFWHAWSQNPEIRLSEPTILALSRGLNPDQSERCRIEELIELLERPAESADQTLDYHHAMTYKIAMGSK